MGSGEKAVEVGERSEARIDIAIVRDVVTEVRHRRGEDGRYPDGVDAELAEIVEPGLDASEVADAVAVTVLEGARINLVDDAALPPGGAHAKRAFGR